MSFFKHCGHHIKRTALNVHGFFRGLLSGTNTGNIIGSLGGMGVGLTLALTGVLSGGIVPAIVTGVALGGIIGMLAGAGIGMVHGLLTREPKEPEAPFTIQPREGLRQQSVEPQVAQEVVQEVETPQRSFAERFAPKAESRPSPIRSEEDVSYRSAIARERLERSVTAAAGAER